jgi:hypothetical protein
VLECRKDVIIAPRLGVKDPYDDGQSVARRPASPSLVFRLRSKVAILGDVVTQTQRVAIFGRRAPAYTTRISVNYPHRNQIFLGGQRRGACRLSPGLHHHTSQQSVRAIVQKMYVHRPPLVDSFPVP